MTKMFCDGCEVELGADGDYVSRRLKAQTVLGKTKVEIEVVVGVDNDHDGNVTWNAGHLCRSCLVKILLSAQ